MADSDAVIRAWRNFAAKYGGGDTSTALYGTVAALVITVLVLVSVILVSLRRKRGDTILLVGLSGSGKTALFYQLRDGSVHHGTVTSMEANEDKFPLHFEADRKAKVRPVHLVDVPGHPRLRNLLEDYLPKAQGIVFVVDALDFVPNVRATAEYLYDVLSKPIVVKKRVPVLIVCNKSDRVTAHSVEFIRKQLEKEMDKLRSTRSCLSSSDGSSGNDIVLGTEGEPFKLTQCSNSITVVEASALSGKVHDVEKFIREQVKA